MYLLLGRRLFSSVFAITEKRTMGLYAVPLFLLDFWVLECGLCVVLCRC